MLQGREQFELGIRMHYRVSREPALRRSWTVETVRYLYALRDNEGREVLSYHWHPAERSISNDPHLHLGPASRVGHRALARAHLPTGLIALQDVLRFAIGELGVRPRRRDWARILRTDRR
jgi:hypothetical protein